MKVRYFLCALLLACGESDKAMDVAARSPQRTALATSECGAAAPLTLSGRGVGALRVGASVDEVRQLCRVISDTIETSNEADEIRVLRVELRGDTLVSVVDSGRVWRVEVGSSRYRTADSLGVGSTLSQLLERGVSQGAEGDGVLYIQSRQHCGMSFRLALELADAQHRDTWSVEQLGRLDGQSRVDRVLVTGCK